MIGYFEFNDWKFHHKISTFTKKKYSDLIYAVFSVGNKSKNDQDKSELWKANNGELWQFNINERTCADCLNKMEMGIER